MKFGLLEINSIGLSEMDAILGERAKCWEVYKSYSERHFVKFDNEVRHFWQS